MTWLVEDKDLTPPGEQMAALWKRPEILRMPGAHHAYAEIVAKRAGSRRAYPREPKRHQLEHQPRHRLRPRGQSVSRLRTRLHLLLCAADARLSGLSPGLDFETKLLFKPDVAELLERELRKPGYVARPLALGSNTDPYQPIERTLKLTRAVLEVLERCGHPLSIVTKSATVVRDIDILAPAGERNLVHVWLSVTTLDPKLARIMEPRASSPAMRLQAVATLSAAGVRTGVLAAPMIPAVNDAELEAIIAAAAKAGAETAGYVLLRLPHELRGIFTAWLEEHMPDRAKKVLELVRQTRAGDLNNSRFGQRFTGTGAYADLLAKRFSRAARQAGLEARPELDCSQFLPPGGPVRRGMAEAQMALF